MLKTSTDAGKAAAPSNIKENAPIHRGPGETCFILIHQVMVTFILRLTTDVAVEHPSEYVPWLGFYHYPTWQQHDHASPVSVTVVSSVSTDACHKHVCLL